MDSSQESFKNTAPGRATIPHHREPIETPPKGLRPKGCGVFGTAANRGLCSNCMEEKSSPASGSTPVSLDLMISPANNPFPCFHATRKRKRTYTDDDVIVNSPPLIEKKRSCRSCSKKVGLMGFNCKCGKIFCGVHRHPEEHDCDFDFKIAGKIVLIKENPVCKGDKLKNRV